MKWVLPEYIEDILPAEAMRIEKPVLASEPPRGSASPRPATILVPSGPATNAPTPDRPPSTDAVKATAPVGLTAGERPKYENVPPPGAASPIATRLCGERCRSWSAVSSPVALFTPDGRTITACLLKMT